LCIISLNHVEPGVHPDTVRCKGGGQLWNVRSFSWNAVFNSCRCYTEPPTHRLNPPLMSNQRCLSTVSVPDPCPCHARWGTYSPGATYACLSVPKSSSILYKSQMSWSYRGANKRNSHVCPLSTLQTLASHDTLGSNYNARPTYAPALISGAQGVRWKEAVG
jgi:hypothetical protein